MIPTKEHKKKEKISNREATREMIYQGPSSIVGNENNSHAKNHMNQRRSPHINIPSSCSPRKNNGKVVLKKASNKPTSCSTAAAHSRVKHKIERSSDPCTNSSPGDTKYEKSTAYKLSRRDERHISTTTTTTANNNNNDNMRQTKNKLRERRHQRKVAMRNDNVRSPNHHKIATAKNRKSMNYKIGRESIIDKEAKVKLIQERAKKRDKRIIQTRKRKDKIEKDRREYCQSNSGVMRRQRMKKQADEKRKKIRMIYKWTMIVVLGSRLQAATQMIQQFRQYKRQVELEDKASRTIARQMRILKFRLYRKRVRGAIRVLANVFLIKVRLWRNSRRRLASDRVKAFLLALEKCEGETGGCLALIVKGKKWRAYRMKIIILQRLWRQRLKIISAQVLLIDRQWQQEQNQRTELEVERIYKEAETKVAAENEHIENINRTRKLIKLRPLPRKKCDNCNQIRAKILQGVDLLSIGNIVPIEIRYGIIRDMLKHMRIMHLNQLKTYNKALKIFKEEVRDRQRRRALLVRFSGNNEVSTWIWGKNKSRSDVTGFESNELPPIKPFPHIILGATTLSILLALGQKYVNALRKLWNPKTMDIVFLPYNGKDATEAHFKENPDIVATAKRNESLLSSSKVLFDHL
jgi:hypothetical protein